MLVDTCKKFREYSLSGFQVIERTRFLRWTKFQGKLLKKYKWQSYHSCTMQVISCLLIFVLSFVNIAYEVFKLKSGHDFCDAQSSKGNYSKSIKGRVTTLALCTSSHAD